MPTTLPQPPSGPYESEHEARAAAHQVVSPEPGWSILRAEGNRELLRRALDEAGVEMGAYDERIAAWVASWEDTTVAVIAGWITRAARGAAPAAGPLELAAVLGALAEAAARREDRAARHCPDCDAHPAGLCDDHAVDLDQAARYREVERKLTGGAR